MRVVRCALVGALLITACPLEVSGWQTQHTEPLSDPAADHDRQVIVDDSAEVRQAKLLRVQRQKQLISDSDKLLKLATDLNQQIDNTPAETLSADSVKKAAEIEKLAHSLRQRLKN
jgi:HAMP domain-containing protein